MASIFYEPCCEVLKSANAPMRLADVVRAIKERFPEVHWSGYPGPVRACLINAVEDEGSPILMVNEQPPKFYYQGSTVISTGVDVEESVDEIVDIARGRLKESLKRKIREKLYRVDPTSFEHLVTEVISRTLNGKGVVTQQSHDGGVDGYVTLPQDPFEFSQVCVQAKHHNNENGRVNESEVRSFIGALNGRNGIVVTNTKFAPKAEQIIKSCRTSRVIALDGDGLIDRMIECGIGLERFGEPIIPMRIDEDYFEELGG